MSKIKLQNVSKKIGKRVILDDISLELDNSVIYGLKGRNGCGKTMLMRMIAGLILPSSGEVYIDEKQLHKTIPFPPSMGLLIENPAFLPNYTGRENLRMLAKLSGRVSEKDVDDALEMVSLDPADKRKFRQYSLGMKQKLGIANAIMGEPDIILLDEPINAIDEESFSVVREILRNLKKKGKLIIIACHDKDELYYLSDEIIMIKNGRIDGRETVIHEDDQTD